MRKVCIDASGADMETRQRFWEKVRHYGIIESETHDLSRFEFYPEEYELDRLLDAVSPSFSVTVIPPL